MNKVFHQKWMDRLSILANGRQENLKKNQSVD